MKKNILTVTEQYIRHQLGNNLPPDFLYHDLEHTLSVREVALQLGKDYQLNEEQLEILELAAFLHDSGYTKDYQNHEEAGAEIAQQFLSKQDYPADKIKKVQQLILATKITHQPTTLSEKIIRDADLNNLGQKKYIETISNLRHEMVTIQNQKLSDKKFLKNNIAFIDQHEYHTQKARERFDARKAKNRKKVADQLKKIRRKALRKKKSKATGNIHDSRGAQMIFKTTLRNHIDLTAIADNKANIMLSINALIITITLPTLATNMSDHPELILPAAMLLLTCTTSMFFATLATRPIKTKGNTSLKQINTQATNLFFFGNFYRMNFPDYKEGIKTVLKDPKKLDDSITSDLYHLGKALGGKFNQLRICYTVFMVGIILTVLTFVISFWLIG